MFSLVDCSYFGRLICSVSSGLIMRHKSCATGEIATLNGAEKARDMLLPPLPADGYFCTTVAVTPSLHETTF